MPNTPHGVYSNRPWIAPPEAAYPPQAYIGPFASNQEQNLSQAMASLQMSSEDIQQYVRPNLPQIQLFPERFGYETYQYGIEDIIDMESRTKQQQRTDYSQAPTTQESSSRNTLGHGV
jgi:hypothetical protein